MRRFPLWPVALLLAGCASLSPEQCVRADWRQIGFSDGAVGASAARINDHAKACAEVGVRPDLDAYLRGREQGLVNYCQPENGFAVGRSGNLPNAGDCPEPMKPAFMDQYRDGYQVHVLETDLAQRRSHIYRNNQLIRRSNERIHAIREELAKSDLPDDRRKSLLNEFNRLVDQKNHLGRENAFLVLEAERLQGYLDMRLRQGGRWRWQ
ncbi:MAG TPA: DUF2799 domain-containing protein [Noviherbaspirillum sp.]